MWFPSSSLVNVRGRRQQFQFFWQISAGKVMGERDTKEKIRVYTKWELRGEMFV